MRAEAEVANRAVDAVPIDPNVRVSEPGGQPAAMEVNTDPVVERAVGAAPQPDVSQVQPMEVSLEQRATTGSTKRAAETQLTPNTVEGYIGGLRSFDRHQAEQAHLLSAIEVTKDDFSVDTIDDDSRRYDYYTRELLGRKRELDQLESCGVIRRVKESGATDGAHVF